MGMILAIDMGNTNIVIGCIDDKQIYFEERLSTDRSKTALEYAISFKNVLELHNIDSTQIEGSILSSVVPSLTRVVRSAVEKILGKLPMVVGPGIKTGLNIHMDNPRGVGSDLIVDSVAGIAEYGAPLIIIDLGTATTLSVIDKNRNYIGGAILPGLRLAMEALSAGAAQLYNVSLEVPKNAIGKNTSDCMQSGMILGNAAALDGMIDRMTQELGYDVKVIATGGLASVITPLCRHEIIYDDALLLKGLKLIYDRNRNR